MHVLIVDDNADIRMSLRLVLEDAGYVVSEVVDGQAALDVLSASDEPLLVILDHHMPRMNGPDLLQHIDQHPALAHHRAFIFMSAVHDPMSFIAPLLARLPLSILPKPFDIADVTDLVGRLSDAIAAPVAAFEHSAQKQEDGDPPI
jgi:CheY-like chemotaxis protein